MSELRIAEKGLNAGLSIVKVALDSRNGDIFATLCDHLQLLYIGNAVVRVKYQYLRVLNIGKALERRLAGIAARGNKDAHLFRLAAFFKRCGEQVRQNLQRHVLKGAGRAVPKLQNGGLAVNYMKRRNGGIIEIIAVSCADDALYLRSVELIKEQREKLLGSATVIGLAESLYLRKAQLRQLLGHEQAAVRCKSVNDGMCRTDTA